VWWFQEGEHFVLPLEILLLLLQILWENLNYWESTQTTHCLDEIFGLMITLHVLKACMEKKIVAMHLMLCKTFLSNIDLAGGSSLPAEHCPSGKSSP